MKPSIRSCLAWLSGIAVGTLALASAVVVMESRWLHTDDVSSVPHRSVALLLGTSKSLENGAPNPFYEARIKALAALYHAYKIDCVLISGDNTSREYNEPVMIQNSLLELGVPAERTYLDYAWVRTLDSLLRARDVFGLSSFTVVSQAFHNERAIYLGRKSWLDVFGFDAGSVPVASGFPTYFREAFSRLVAIWDILVQTPQKFSGEAVSIEYNPLIRPIPKKICSPRGEPDGGK